MFKCLNEISPQFCHWLSGIEKKISSKLESGNGNSSSSLGSEVPTGDWCFTINISYGQRHQLWTDCCEALRCSLAVRFSFLTGPLVVWGVSRVQIVQFPPSSRQQSVIWKFDQIWVVFYLLPVLWECFITTNFALILLQPFNSKV